MFYVDKNRSGARVQKGRAHNDMWCLSVFQHIMFIYYLLENIKFDWKILEVIIWNVLIG